MKPKALKITRANRIVGRATFAGLKPCAGEIQAHVDGLYQVWLFQASRWVYDARFENGSIVKNLSGRPIHGPIDICFSEIRERFDNVTVLWHFTLAGQDIGTPPTGPPRRPRALRVTTEETAASFLSPNPEVTE